MEATRILAEFASTTRPEAVPAAVAHEAVRALVNWTACALGGSTHETLDRALAALRPFAGAAQATVLGRGLRLDALHAALLNGISSHVLDFDDTHLATLVHPSGPVLSAVLALAEHRPVDGRTFLHAFVLGVEVECRIARAIYPAHYDCGWHITGTAGVFGAAAAAGRLLALDSPRMAQALGLAATQASGLREMFGTMGKSLHPGRAARDGLAAALLAAAGFTGSPRAIEARHGFAHVLSPERDFDVLVERLGERWEIAANSYKPYACGVVIHPVIDACMELRNTQGWNLQNVESVAARVHPLVIELTGNEAPRTGLEGKFSVHHSAAVALRDGDAGPRQYTDAAIRDPEIAALRRRVSVRAEPGIREDEARVAIACKDGKVLEKHVRHALGSLERPMSDAQLGAKFRALASAALEPGALERCLELCWRADALSDAGEIGRAAAGAPRREGSSG